MRHGNKINHLGRKIGHRAALLKNLAAALIQHKRINTTLAKARELRRFIEPLITKSKDNTTHSRRIIFSYLQNKEALKELFATIAPKIATRPGGYLRVIKTGWRSGDAAEMALIEFVDFNELYVSGTKPGVAEASLGEKKKRTRRGAKKAKTTEPGDTDTVVTAEEGTKE